MRLFRRKVLSEIDKELKKYPRKERKKLKELYAQYQARKILIARVSGQKEN